MRVPPRLRTWWPVLFCGGVLLVFFHPLMSTSRLLAVRDIPFFHLPLRTVFARLAAEGLPLWNPMIHGGQPIISNPNYAACYPPSWLALALPAHLALNLVVLIHAGLGLWGAWRLARHLGADRAPAALAGLGFAGGGAFVSAPNTLNLFCGLAWLPWILLWADRALRTDGGSARRAATVLAGGGIAAQLLAGEPVMVVVSALAVLCLALAAPGSRRKRLLPLVAILLLAILLGSVQLLPTLARLGETARAGGLEGRQAMVWSTPPQRLVEWLMPRFFGDPMLEDDGLYFGYGIHDADFPYLISIYSGQALLILALAALLRWPIALRSVWITLILLGIALALGRHNPLYAHLLARLPPFSMIRYPEKFLLLATTGIAFAGALGWGHLLASRRSERPERADFPFALAVVALGIAGVLLAVLLWRPETGAWFVRTRSLAPRGEEELLTAYRFLGGEALIACLWAAVTAALLALHRWRRPPSEMLAALLLLAVGADLWYYSRHLNPVAPAAEVLAPPAPARALAAERTRIFSDQFFYLGQTELTYRSSTSELPPWLHNGLERMDPYVGNLWGLTYALNEDFDVMLTHWARHALVRLYGSRRNPQDGAPEVFDILGAWNVGTLVLRRPMEEVAREWLDTSRDPPLTRLQSNRQVLPRFRFVRSVSFQRDLAATVEAARAAGFRVSQRDFCVHADGPAGVRTYDAAAEVLGWREGGSRSSVDYRASGPAFLVAAVTFDRSWRARVDGRPARLFPTALGQIGVELPPGERRLTLEYRDPAVSAGAAVTLLTLAAILAWIMARGLRERRRKAGRIVP